MRFFRWLKWPKSRRVRELELQLDLAQIDVATLSSLIQFYQITGNSSKTRLRRCERELDRVRQLNALLALYAKKTLDYSSDPYLHRLYMEANMEAPGLSPGATNALVAEIKSKFPNTRLH